MQPIVARADFVHGRQCGTDRDGKFSCCETYRSEACPTISGPSNARVLMEIDLHL